MGFLGNIGKKLFGESSKIKKKTMYAPEDLAQWMGKFGPTDFGSWMDTMMGGAQPYLANILKDYFGATAPMMGGAFGGQQGTFASQGVASQLPYLMNLALQGSQGSQLRALQALQGQKQLYEKPGSAGLVGSLVPGIGLGLGAGAVPFLGSLLSGGGGSSSPFINPEDRTISAFQKV